MSSGSFRVAGLLGVRTGDVGFIRGRCVHQGVSWGFWLHWGSLGYLFVPWWLSCSFGVDGFIVVRPSVSCALFGLGMFVRRFIVVRPGLRRVLWLNWEAPSVSSCLFGVHWFIGVCTASRRVLSGSLGSLRYALGVFGFVRGRWVHWCTSWRSSRSFGDCEFIRKRPGSRYGLLRWTLGFVWFVPGHWIHWGAQWRSLERLVYAERIVGFVRSSRLHWGAPWVSSSSFGVTRFIAVSSGSFRFAGFISVRPVISSRCLG